MVPEQQADLDPAVWPNIELRGRSKVVIGRSSTCQVTLPHRSVSAEHACFHVLPTGVEIEDLRSRFGTTVNGARVGRTRLKSGDLVRFGVASVAYRFVGDGLRVDAQSHGLDVHMADIGFAISGRQLLSDIRLEFRANTFAGILGPSGTGKSLLLGCLATTLQPTSGQITFDDDKPLAGPTLAYYRSRLGLVAQEDLVYMALTVRENVRFAAELRLCDTPTAQLEETIDGVLRDVAMTEHQHKLVSVLSGGQRKRLSVAIELLLRPGLLVLDEPTSGLDPGMQANLMDRLRGLARQGITVVASSHTLDTLHYFDSVIVLARRGGSTTCVFQGPPAGLLPAFNKRDLADLFDHLSSESDAESPADSIVLPSLDAPTSQDATRSPSRSRTLVPGAPPAVGPRGRARVARQAQVIARRSWLTFRRDSMALRLAICQPFLLAGLIFFSQLTPCKPLFIHTFLVIAAIWLGMTVTVREIVRERALYLRDRLAGLLPNGYLVGKALFAAGVATTQCVVLYATARLLIGLDFGGMNQFARDLLQGTNFVLGSMAFFVLGSTALILAGLGGAFIGLTVSSLSRTEQAAVAMLPLLILPQLLFSRTSAGESRSNWGSSLQCAYAPIAIVGEGARSNRLQFFASLPMLSRPATAALDMLPYHRSDLAHDREPVPDAAGDLSSDCQPGPGAYVKLSWLIVEWFYFVFLVALLGTACYLVFHLSERNWRSVR